MASLLKARARLVLRSERSLSSRDRHARLGSVGMYEMQETPTASYQLPPEERIFLLDF